MKPWIKQQLNQLEHTINASHLPHALIIGGLKDIGKLELAQKLVQKLTNFDVSFDNLAIDEKNDKILIRHSNYNSLIYCQREIKKDAKKPSLTIGVNQIRKFCNFLSKTNANLQIGIIKYSDELHNSAANALLKTLEEPRKNTLIIILAHNSKKIPATILSRCQKIHLYATNDSLEWIKNNIKFQVDEKIIEQLLIENNFVPSIVVKKINNEEYKNERKWFDQLLTMAINPNNINHIENNNNEVKIINCLQNLVIISIKMKIAKTTTENISHKYILQKSDIKMLFKLLNDINYAKNLLNTTINIKLLLDNLLIVWSHITHLQTYPQFLKKPYESI